MRVVKSDPCGVKHRSAKEIMEQGEKLAGDLLTMPTAICTLAVIERVLFEPENLTEQDRAVLAASLIQAAFEGRNCLGDIQ